MPNSTLFQYSTITTTPFLDIQDTLPADEAAIFESSLFIDDANPSLELELDKYLSRNVKQRYPNVTFKDHGILTRRGYKKDRMMNVVQNQDRAIIIHPQREVSIISNFTKDDFFIGIFDGHGTNGHLISEYVSKHLFDTIKTMYFNLHTKQGFGMQDAIEKSFAELQTQIISLKSDTKQSFLSDVPSDPLLAQQSGCTASIFMRLGDSIYSANVGDSSSLIGVYSKTEQKSHIVFRNRKDKPHLPSEKKRIEAHGGLVIPPRMIGGQHVSSRAFNVEHHVGFAMSRVFGDLDAQSIGVSAEPIVQVLSIESIRSKFNNEDIMFALVMSDGLVEYVKEQDVIDELGKALSDQDNLDAKGMMDVLQDIIMKSSKSWLNIDMGYRDDISIAFQVIEG
jgi:serine/threonine protein phosphatase PrpC